MATTWGQHIQFIATVPLTPGKINTILAREKKKERSSVRRSARLVSGRIRRLSRVISPWPAQARGRRAAGLRGERGGSGVGAAPALSARKGVAVVTWCGRPTARQRQRHVLFFLVFLRGRPSSRESSCARPTPSWSAMGRFPPSRRVQTVLGGVGGGGRRQSGSPQRTFSPLRSSLTLLGPLTSYPTMGTSPFTHPSCPGGM